MENTELDPRGSRSPSVLIVEDEELVARALRQICKRRTTPICVATESAAIRAITKSPALEVALIDVQLGSDPLAGLRVLDHFVTRNPHARRALITGSNDRTVLRHAFEQGALFLPKPLDHRSLEALASILTAAAKPRPSALETSSDLASFVEARLADLRLCGKQARIVQLAVDGREHDEISTQLGIERNTLRTHVERLLRRTGQKSVAALARQILYDFSNRPR